MPSSAGQSNSSRSFIKNALTPNVLFLTLILSIALTIRAESTSKEHCFICSGIKLFVRTVCGLMDIFIMFIKLILNKIVATKSRFNSLLEAARCKSTGRVFQLPDDKMKSIVEIEQPAVNDPPTIRRKTFSIEERRETITTIRELEREPSLSNDEQTRDSFIEFSPPDPIDIRPSRSKPIPSFVVIPRISVTVGDISNDMKKHETTELEEKNIQEAEEEVAKDSVQPQEPGSTRAWRSESLDGPKELFELTKPVPIYADDSSLLGYDNGRGGVMQLGGYYLDGDVIPLNSNLTPGTFSPGKSEKDFMQKSILKDEMDLVIGSDDDNKKRVTLTYSDEEWAANCDCTDEETKTVPVISDTDDNACVDCNCDEGTVVSTPSAVHWAHDCKSNQLSKISVSVKSIQAPNEELKEESVTVPQINPSIEPPVESEAPQTVYTGPWRSESLDGPKQSYKGEDGGFTKKEEEKYFLKEGKCSRYDDNKCKKCRCYRMKFSREQFNKQANLYKGCLANTGMKRKRTDSVPRSKSQPLETSLNRSNSSSKVLSTDLKSIKSLDQSIITSGERCRCNSNTSEINFRSTDCKCPSTGSKKNGSISAKEDRCRCFDASKTSQRLNEMNNKGDDCKCSKTDSKLTGSVSQRSVNDSQCHCLDSDTKHIKSELISSTSTIRCHCHDESGATLVKSSTRRGKNCKCSETNSKPTNSVSQRSLADNNRCHCHDSSVIKRIKSENLQRSKDCKCSSTNSELKSPDLGRSVKDDPCRCLNTSDPNHSKYKKSKDCSCPSTISKRSSPVLNLIVSESQRLTDKEPRFKTNDTECFTEGLCCQHKHSGLLSTESNIVNSDFKQTREGFSMSSKPKTMSTRLNDTETQNRPVTKMYRPDPKLLGGLNDEFDAEFTGLRAAKYNIPMRTIRQQHQRTQIGESFQQFVKEQKRIEQLSLQKKKDKKKKFK